MDMLETLKKITQEVNAVSDLATALSIIVKRVKSAMVTHVASVYLLDQQQNCYRLMATEGLNQAAVGKVTLEYAQGLVGQVGLREEPINLENAADHPSYRYFEETGEERYHAFLGVPIMHRRKLLGVLVVQQEESRCFDQSEEAFLVTLSAQLAGVIAHAEVTGLITQLSGSQKVAKCSGIPGSAGIAIGVAVVHSPGVDLSAIPKRMVEAIEEEEMRFLAALQMVRDDIAQAERNFGQSLPKEEGALFDVYLRMLDQHALGGEIVLKIREGYWAQSALAEIINTHIHNFNLLDDPYLKERAMDVKELGIRLLTKLGVSSQIERKYPERTILVGEEVTAALLMEVPRECLVGVVSVRGSANSHLAIVARSMGIPTVVGALDLPVLQLEGRELIVDGYRGEIISNPNREMRQQYEQMVLRDQSLQAELQQVRDQEAVMLGGHKIGLWLNTGLVTDASLLLDQSVEGVGLYRTEMAFMLRDRFPSEKEQEVIYRRQLEAFAPRPVNMRTLDIGGDKVLSYFPIYEENPFLGWRGIRVTLDHPEIFMVQIRAMLKASVGLNNLRIMLPMISTVFEVEEALRLIHRSFVEVSEEGFDIVMPSVGAMIEVPAAVYQILEIATRVDFISVGTNDLTQYMLAVDRNNPRVANLYHSYHPAVLKALQIIINAARAVGKPSSVCGEMAGDPVGALLLVAMGYDALSMSAAHLLKVKWLLRKISFAQAQSILREVLAMDNAQVIHSHLELLLAKQGLDGLLGPM